MVIIWLPRDTAYTVEPCGDWGVYVLKDSIADWLNANCPGASWDHDEGHNGGASIMINNPSTALLFKLTWGGR